MKIELFYLADVIKRVPHIRTNGSINIFKVISFGSVFAIEKPAGNAFGLDFILDGDFFKKLRKFGAAVVVGISPKAVWGIAIPRYPCLDFIV